MGFSYQNGDGNLNLTGSPDYGAPHPPRRRPGQRLQQRPVRQFNASAFQGPLTNSDGLESGTDYVRGCFQSALDLAIARNIQLGGRRNCSCVLDMFNAPNQAIVTNRSTTANFASLADPAAITNLPFDAAAISSRHGRLPGATDLAWRPRSDATHNPGPDWSFVLTPRP